MQLIGGAVEAVIFRCTTYWRVAPLAAPVFDGPGPEGKASGEWEGRLGEGVVGRLETIVSYVPGSSRNARSKVGRKVGGVLHG